MSFLSSILSTIGDRPPAPAAATRGRPPTPGQSKPPAPKVSPANGAATGQATKRKAEDSIGGVPSKSQRRYDPTKNLDRPSSSIRTVATATSTKTQASSSSSTNPLPYRGTAREGSAPAATTTAAIKPVPRPLPVVPKSSSLNPSQPSSRPTSKPTTPTSTAPPKRGSYQEILARAKAQQAQQSQVGVIKHKKVEQPVSKKERLAQQQAEAKNKSATGKDTKKPARVAEEAGGKSGEPAKERKKPADVGYHGTMRPSTAEPSYKGTMKPGAAGKGRPSAYDPDRSYNSGYRGTAAAGRKDKGRAGGYGGYSDEEEEEDDYYSDASSDMEAAAFDLEEEEMYSLRIARKEDEEAQREEDELKRKKEQRKNMLAKMAADNAKKRRY